MSRFFRAAFLLAILLTGLFMLSPILQTSEAKDSPPPPLLIGRVLNQQSQPIPEANVQLLAPGQQKPLGEAQTHQDGSYILNAPGNVPGNAYVVFKRSHFESQKVDLSSEQIKTLDSGETVVLPEVTLPLKIGEAFWDKQGFTEIGKTVYRILD